MNKGQVEIYVRSSALGGVGIHWRNISKAEQPNEEPSVLKQRVITKDDDKSVTVSSLINDTKPSLILARYESKIFLEVTGLEAAEIRSKKMGRRISEIVLWVGDATKEIEYQLRQLAAYALFSFWQQDSIFTNIIRDSIDFDGLDSFKANAEQIEKLYIDAATNLAQVLSKVTPSETDGSKLVWLNEITISNDSQLYTLLNQISQTALPEIELEQPMVVVAKLKKEGDKREIVYKNWKKKPKPEPETKPESEMKPEPKPEPQPESELQPQTLIENRLASVGIFLVLTILLAILLIVLTPRPALPPAPKEIPKEVLSNETTNAQNLPQPTNSPIPPSNQTQPFLTQLTEN